MRYIKWMSGCVAAACAVFAATALRPLLAAAEPSAGSVVARSYSGSAGTRSYEIYVPPSYQPGTAMPLVVALHGCTESADKFRSISAFDDLAAAKGFIVVYPEQPSSANYLTCWNWFQNAHMSRGSGEPSLIAGITTEVQSQYTIDPHRTYVTGFSAGGAMAAVMGATYPDLYAAIGVGSGCEYAAGAACAGYQSADPEQAGRQAFQAMGANARAVPLIDFQGDQDKTVPPKNAQQLMRAEQVTADLADDGSENNSIPRYPTKTDFGWVSGGHSYTVTHYSDGHGHELAQAWLVHGMGHAWSGSTSGDQYADAAGPNESSAMYDFFMAHPAP